MKISYLGHTCVLVETAGRRVLCDPWLTDPAYVNSWWHWPPVDVDPRSLDPVDFIYTLARPPRPLRSEDAGPLPARYADRHREFYGTPPVDSPAAARVHGRPPAGLLETARGLPGTVRAADAVESRSLGHPRHVAGALERRRRGVRRKRLHPRGRVRVPAQGARASARRGASAVHAEFPLSGVLPLPDRGGQGGRAAPHEAC